jgi:transcriptional regulator with XRE-family HTH domain
MRYQTDRPSLYPDIGENIRMARVKQRISQRELGRRLGVSHAAISDIERAKTRPDIDTLAVIADALDVPLQRVIMICRPPPPGPAATEGKEG